MISEALVNITKTLVEVCRKQNISIVLMGGMAVSFYAKPRATYDIDGIIYSEKGNLDKFLSELSKKGFKYDRKNPIKIIHGLPFLTLFNRTNRLYADLFIAENEFQKGIIKRAKKIKLGNMKLKIISPEDLILLKLQTGREKDNEDARSILYENYKILDFKYLKYWAKRLNAGIFLNDKIKSLRIKT